ncbi:MAG: FAD-linked oxidase C-terminal domain-containing protein [Phycisphaeraceae bacterium]
MPAHSAPAAIARFIDIVGPGGVLFNPDELLVYECDGFPIAKGLPACVVFPTNTQQVAACVETAIDFDLPIIPRGSGTGLAGGAVGFGEGVLITTSRMTKIEHVDVKNRFAIVQAGVRNLALSDFVAHTGLRFSPDPSSQRASTIGGNASTNAGGINTLKHGVTSNHILGMEVVLPDASVITTRIGGLCDGLGADLPGLICGSEGTFGIITRIWCRLVPSPRNFRTFYAVYNTTREACKTVSDVIASGIVPTSMEMMDGQMIQIVEDAFHFGFPRDAQALLLLEVDGIEQILDEQMASIVAVANDNGAKDISVCSDPKRRAELWSARKKAFGAIGRVSHSYCTQDACVPRSMLPDVMERVGELGRQYGIRITNVFHAGDGNIHPIMMFDEDDPTQVQHVLKLSEDILEYCVSVGGTITGEHGVGVEKLHLMHTMFNPDTIDTFQKIKKTFDPQQRVNEGKLVPSDRVFIEIVKPIAKNSPGGAVVTQV